tara:strand:+ start:75 stop:602 length:528 start_codon:yes stop_codon:yes gene_type:complete
MNWDNVKSLIGNSAPIIGGLLGGPAGAGIGTLISSVLGVEDNPNAVINELKANPEAMLKLQQMQTTHKEKLEEFRLSEIEMNLKDVASARDRQIKSETATGQKDWNLYALAWLIVGGYFGLIFFLLSGTVPEDKTGVIYMLFGTLATAFGGVIQYFFGSSAGSKQKTDVIHKLKG